MRGHQLCSHSMVSQNSMEPKGSLSSSQELSTCTYPEPDQSSPTHPVLSLTTHLWLHFPGGFFPSGFPTSNLYIFLFSPIHATCPTHLITLNLIILIILHKEYKSRSSSLCSFLHRPITSSLFGPNILLSTLFSNSLSLRSSLNVRDQVSHPYRITGKIIVLCIVIF
jgi:hypothetical protein